MLTSSKAQRIETPTWEPVYEGVRDHEPPNRWRMTIGELVVHLFRSEDPANGWLVSCPPVCRFKPIGRMQADMARQLALVAVEQAFTEAADQVSYAAQVSKVLV